MNYNGTKELLYQDKCANLEEMFNRNQEKKALLMPISNIPVYRDHLSLDTTFSMSL